MLLKCPECGRKVSDLAPGCPGCGAPMDSIKRRLEPQREYFLLIEDKEQGPFSRVQLQGMYLSGSVNKNTLFAKDGMQSWEKLETILMLIFPEGDHVATADKSGSVRLADRKMTAPEKMFLGVVLLLALIFGVPSLLPEGGNDKKVGRYKADAYQLAKDFVFEAMPGAQKVSGYAESQINTDGWVYYVDLKVDGLNAFGGPVRNILRVEVHRDRTGDRWGLIRIQPNDETVR